MSTLPMTCRTVATFQLCTEIVTVILMNFRENHVFEVDLFRKFIAWDQRPDCFGEKASTGHRQPTR